MAIFVALWSFNLGNIRYLVPDIAQGRVIKKNFQKK